MKVNDKIGWAIRQGVGYGIGRCVGDETDSDVCDEVSEGAEL